MAKYYKFYLKPGQQPPNGTTSISMPDGGIVWIGDEWVDSHIYAHEMTLSEIDEYNLFLEYRSAETDFHISFEQFKNKASLILAKDEIISKINAEISKKEIAIKY